MSGYIYGYARVSDYFIDWIPLKSLWSPPVLLNESA